VLNLRYYKINNMTTITNSKKLIKREKIEEIQKLKIKAMILDELLEFIEDKYFGYLMKITENEQNIPLSKAKKFFK